MIITVLKFLMENPLWICVSMSISFCCKETFNIGCFHKCDRHNMICMLNEKTAKSVCSTLNKQVTMSSFDVE